MSWRRGLAIAVLVAALVVGRAPAMARDTASVPFEPPLDERFCRSAGRIFPATALLFRPLLADPNELRSYVRLVKLSDGEVHIPVSIGLAAPALNLLLENGEGLQVALGASVAARFEQSQNMDLKATDWRYSIPVMWTSRETVYRLELRHFSSHVGDEYIERTGAKRLDALSDSLVLLIARSIRPTLRVYYGGAYNYHARPVDESCAFQAGLEWAAAGHFLGLRGPYAAIDFSSSQTVDYHVTTSAVIGLAVPGEVPGRECRVEILYTGGPSRMGEFLLDTEQYWGAGVAFDL